jgi:hypothetical protein
MAKQLFTAFKNIYSVGSAVMAPGTVDVFETNIKRLVVRAKYFPS